MTTKRIIYQRAAEKVTAGTTITATKLRKLCGIKKSTFPKTQLGRDQLRFALISAYTGMNKHLSNRGLYIKSKGYYTSFTVLSGHKQVDKVVVAYRNAAKTKVDKGINLSLNL